MFLDKFEFAKGYKIHKCKTLAEYRTAIEALPLNDTPEAFGLHPNANITYQTNTADEILSTIVSIQPKDSSSGVGETREAVVYRLCDDMLQKLPDDYVPHEVKAALIKMDILQPLNIFLKQEVDRMQKVITNVRNTLKDLKLAIDGTIIMNEKLRDALDNMYDARVPLFWRKYVSSPFGAFEKKRKSCKFSNCFRISWESATLGFWFTDLLDRNAQFSSWLFQGKPNCFWLTGFFNPQVGRFGQRNRTFAST